MGAALQRRTHWLQITAAAAGLATVMLVIILFLPKPLGTDHYSILAGLRPLSLTQRQAYQHALALNFSFDNTYLIAHIVMWLGLATLAWRCSPPAACAMLFFGLGGGTLDFLENSMRWTYAMDFGPGLNIDRPALRAWSIVYNLSYTAIFVAAALAAITAVGARHTGYFLTSIGLAGVIPLPGSYFEGYDITYYWLIAWHLAAAAHLFATGAKRGRPPTRPISLVSEVT